ncbi:MAG: hypothetical protein ACOX7R_06965 [Acetivibrionales bacterium]|jgi:hypothetical protein
MYKDTLRILSPNGQLGFTPTKEESFWIGAKTKADYYCCGPGVMISDRYRLAQIRM